MRSEVVVLWRVRGMGKGDTNPGGETKWRGVPYSQQQQQEAVHSPEHTEHSGQDLELAGHLRKAALLTV
jgi:hypothetical protein